MTDQLHQDCIAAKAFEMAADEAHATQREEKWFINNTRPPREIYNSCCCEIADSIRALSAASARRQLQLDLINRAIEEAEWWEDYSRSQGFRCIRWEWPGAECAHKSCLRLASLKSQRTQLESEIAALEAT